MKTFLLILFSTLVLSTGQAQTYTARTALPTDPTFNSVTTPTITSVGALNISSGGSFQTLTLTAAGNLVLSTPNGATQLARPLLLMGGGLYFGPGDGDSGLYGGGPAAFALGNNTAGNASGSLSLGNLNASGTVHGGSITVGGNADGLYSSGGAGYFTVQSGYGGVGLTGSDGTLYARFWNGQSAIYGSLTTGPGGNVLHMLATKPTLNGAGSPNDAYFDATNSKLIIFKDSSAQTEGNGHWVQFAGSAYVP